MLYSACRFLWPLWSRWRKESHLASRASQSDLQYATPSGSPNTDMHSMERNDSLQPTVSHTGRESSVAFTRSSYQVTLLSVVDRREVLTEKLKTPWHCVVLSVSPSAVWALARLVRHANENRRRVWRANRPEQRAFICRTKHKVGEDTVRKSPLFSVPGTREAVCTCISSGIRTCPATHKCFTK